MTYITVSEVRNRSGAPTTLITDAQIQSFIDEVEVEMARWLNTKFTPEEMIEIRDGPGLSQIFTRQNPLLSIRAVTANESISITPANINWHKPSGKVNLQSGAEMGTFVTGSQNTFIKYIYGMVVESSVKTSSTADAAVGTSVALTVSSITDFAINDWVEIYGMDGNREVAKINLAPAGSTIQVDQLVKTHESGSIVVKMIIPDYVRVYMMIEAAICVAINAIGATYVFNASYNLGDLQVTKGVPYTHWRESYEKLVKERKMRKARIKPRPSIMVN